jgi:tRNA A58 N-methylase Trm61
VVVVFVVVVVFAAVVSVIGVAVVEDDIDIELSVVTAGAGAGAIAAVVSAGVSSFFAHAARAKTAATRARRFMYFLLKRNNVDKKSPVRARVRGARFWRGGKVNYTTLRVKSYSR